MTGIAKHLARGLNVELSQRVSGVSRAGDNWHVALENGGTRTADAVIVTAPVPQALDLFETGGTELDHDVRCAQSA